MKKIFIITAICLMCYKCNSTKPEPRGPNVHKPISDQSLASGVIYEANIRQYSSEGTFNAFTKDLPKIKELGVNVIWLMPTYPISSTKSKGPLGSYYAISDYKGVNPEFGTLKDLKNLIYNAHQMGMYVIFDWVPGHTGWDHVWVKDHPEYYLKNENGKIIDPIDPRTGESFGWTDVADLDYNQPQMRAAMKDAMLYWIKEFDIDGYRVDQAYAVPFDFLEDVFKSIRKIKPVFIMGELEQDSGKNSYLPLFDGSYDFPGYELNVEIAQGHKTVIDYLNHIDDFVLDHDDSHFLLNFVSTHDKNAWNGTARERFGDAQHAIMASNYLLPGLPLLYSGVEYDLDKRLLFFEKDSFPKLAGETYKLLKKLGDLKKNHPSLNSGKVPGSFNIIQTSLREKVLAFERVKKSDTIVFIANLSKDHIGFTSIYNGQFKRFQDEKIKKLSFSYEYRMQPWEFWILTK
jgi:alpha-amylase|tara:strand:+ start:7076 stop:8455 length:1380 start_codon:yes stop_codon:yes gene_type:complete